MALPHRCGHGPACVLLGILAASAAGVSGAKSSSEKPDRTRNALQIEQLETKSWCQRARIGDVVSIMHMGVIHDESSAHNGATFDKNVDEEPLKFELRSGNIIEDMHLA